MNQRVKKILSTTAKIVVFLVGGVVLLFALTWGALQLPSVQTYVVGKATKWVSSKTKTVVRIQRVDLDFFKTLVLEGIYLEDQQKDTLLYAGEFRVNIGLLGLSSKKVVVNEIGLDNAVVNLNRSKKDSTYNYEFLVDAFASGDTTTTTDTTSSAWTFDLEEMDLNNVRFAMQDEVDGNQLRLGLKNFNTVFSTLGLEEKHPRIKHIRLYGARVAFSQPMVEADTLQKAMAQATQVDSIAKSVEKAAVDQPKTAPTDSVFNSSGFALDVDEIIFKDALVQYDVRNTPRKEKMLDYQHLLVRHLNLDLRDLMVGANNFAANLRNLSFQEQSGLDLQKLAFFAKAELPQATFHLHSFHTNRSAIDDIKVSIASIRDTTNMMRQVRAEANWVDDSLSMQDVALFTDALQAYPALANKRLFLDGKMVLANNALTLQNLRLMLERQLVIQASAFAERLDNLPSSSYRLELDKIQTNWAFVKQFLPPTAVPPQLNQLGEIVLKGRAEGQLTNSNINLTLASSGLGQVTAKAQVRTNDKFDRNSINGTIEGNNLQLNKLVGNGTGPISFRLKIDGQQAGSAIEVQQANLLIKSFIYNGYTYRNVRLDGSYLNQLAKGKLNINDPNLQLTADVNANLRPNHEHVRLNANLAEMDVRQLKFTTDTLVVGTRLHADVYGFDPNRFTGNIKFSEVMVARPKQKALLDSLTLYAGYQEGNRVINLNSDIMQANLAGQFTVEDLPLALEQFVHYYFSRYAIAANRKVGPQRIRFNLKVKENPELLQAMVPGLSIPQPITVEGIFENQQNKLQMVANAPLASFGSYKVYEFRMDVGTNANKLTLAAGANQITTSPTYAIPKPGVRFEVEKDNLTYNLRVANAPADSRLDLNGQLQIRKDTFILRFLPSEIFIKKHAWNIANNSLIVYGPKYLRIDNFMLGRDGQQLTINTKPLSNKQNLILADIKRFNVGELLNLFTTDYQIDGELNGQAQVADLFNKIGLNGDIRLDNLTVNQSRIGDLSAQAAQGPGSEQITFQSQLQGADNNLKLNGHYNTVQPENNMDVRLLIDRIRLEQFAPMVKAFINEMHGNMRADLHIQGSPSKPSVVGNIFFENTLINPVAAGVPFSFNGQTLQFTGSQLQLSAFTIRDEYNRAVVLNGKVDYTTLSNVNVDMRCQTPGFRFLNTPKASGQPVYGELLAAADLTVKGPIDGVAVNGDVNVLRETNLTVALLDDNAEIARPEYINFVSEEIRKRQDSLIAKKTGMPPSEEAAGPTGMSMSVRLRVNREAQFTILIDPKTGDAITCSGRANLLYEMSPQGDMNLLGDYTLEQGLYKLNLFGLIQKEFGIQKGSTLSWSGNPADAKVDITARYEAEVPRYNLISQQLESSQNDQLISAAKLQSPVYVFLKIQGEITEPRLSFDLEVPSSNNGMIDQMVNDQLALIRNDESLLNKQIFGLIALNRFILENNQANYSGTGSTRDAINERVGSTVSEFLSSQLNKLTEEYLGGVQVNVDLQSQLQNGSYSSNLNDKRLAVNLSKELFNDRIVVNVGSNFDFGGANNNTQSNANNVKNMLGNVSVEYKLTPSGWIRLRFFRRLDPNIVTAGTYEQVGASLMHNRSFSNFKDLFRRKRKKHDLYTPTTTQ